MNNIMKDTWNFVFNICNFNITNDGCDIFDNKYSKIKSYNFYMELISRVKKELNITNFGELYKEHKEKYTANNNGIYYGVIKLYTEIEPVIENSKLNRNKLSCLLFKLLLENYNPKEHSALIEKYNTIIYYYGVSYQNGIFVPINPIINEFNNYEIILNLNTEQKVKYNNAILDYEKAFKLYNEENYSLSITKGFSSLESIVKIILKEKGIDSGTNFMNNIKKLIEDNFFNNFNIEAYFSGLACIRNNNSAHGSTVIHDEDKIVTAFYLHNIANSLVLLIQKHDGEIS